MKSFYLLYAMTIFVALVTSCAHEEFDDYKPEYPEITYNATLDIEGDDSKAILGANENGKPQTMWTVGDKITVHNGEEGFEFYTDIKESAPNAEFHYAGGDFDANNGVMAFYPSGEYSIDLSKVSAVVNIPSRQNAQLNTYDPAAAVSVAYSTDNHLRFKNATAMLKFTVATDNIKSVIFQGLNNEIVAGKANVCMMEDGSTISAITPYEGETATSVELVASEYFEVGKTYYLNIIPQTFEKGFNISVRLIEDGVSCTALRYTNKRDVSRNLILNIGELKYDSSSLGDATPRLNKLSFRVIDNSNKILSRHLYYDASSKSTLSNTRTEESFDINYDNNKVSIHIPYLYDFKLVPYFEIPEGTALIYDGQTIQSGKTLIDFNECKQIAVINGNGDSEIYDVEITNTGLPIVVINQETGTVSSTSDSEFAAASSAWYEATGAKWQLKESDWLMTDGVDNFMIYNADGTSALTDKNGATVNKPVLSSTRERGNVSRQMPKKPFAVKLDKKHGIFMNDSDPTNDLPAHKRWVLLANWKDRTLLRNAVANEVAAAFNKTFPNDGIAWNPSGQFVELVYNGVHVGNYYLCEQIKIDENRLNINEPYDAEDAYSGNAAGYGYLLESDDGYDEAWKFMTKMYIPFLFKDDGNDEMLSYAQNLVRGVEDNLRNGNYSTAYNTLDLSSMVDFLLIQELMMNCELQHPKSMYSYINNGKLYAGPIWDFDWNTLAVDGNFECGYSYTKSMLEDASPRYYNYILNSSKYPDVDGGDKSYMWYPMLVKDATFKAKAAERWNAVQGALAQVSANIPKTAEKIRKSEACNYAMWQVDVKSDNIRGNRYGISGGDVKYCGFCGDEGMTFDQAVQALQSNFNSRISGMSYVTNQNWPSKNVSTVRW